MAEATPFVDTTHIGMNNDPLTGLPFNQSRLELRSLRVQDYLLSAGGPLGDPSIMVGASVHYLRGETNLTSASLFGFPNFRVGDVFDAAHPSDGTTSSRFAFDVGALLSVAQSVRIGVVGKYLGAPEFETSDGSKIRIDPRWRSGLAILPVPELTLSVDLDLTRADLGGDSRQRIGAVGAEVQTLKGALALRAGLRDALSGPGDRLYTGGIGVSIGKVTLDAAIGHSPRAGSTSWSIEVSFNSQREGQTRKPPRQ